MATDCTDPSSPFFHQTVLLNEVVAGLPQVVGGYYLDVTLGGGGHSERLLETIPASCVWGLDQDEAALRAAQQRLARFGDRLTLIHCNFADYEPGPLRFDGIIADLGVSSPQFDQAERGFSFRQDAPLDMRMNPQADLTAADILNTWDEGAIAQILYEYGEERLSRRIARRILEQRPLQTTTDLANLVACCYPPKARYGRIHPATRTFQALRIAVNRELEALDQLLVRAPKWLKPGGVLGIISFHSLEDRRVKIAFRSTETLQVLTKKPIAPSPEEVASNPRARSAKLRLAQRIDAPEL
jgi:16S rRNA (cytosine1402-N4)-methyltransferase